MSKLVVTLTLTADHEDGKRFSEASQTCHGMERGEFHALQAELARMLLGLGETSAEAHASKDDDDDEDDGEDRLLAVLIESQAKDVDNLRVSVDRIRKHIVSTQMGGNPVCVFCGESFQPSTGHNCHRAFYRVPPAAVPSPT